MVGPSRAGAWLPLNRVAACRSTRPCSLTKETQRLHRFGESVSTVAGTSNTLVTMMQTVISAQSAPRFDDLARRQRLALEQSAHR